MEPDGACTVAMTLADDESTRAAWPHAFHARFVVTAGRQLRMTLEIRNTGAADFTFEAALHTYLAVSDVRRIRVQRTGEHRLSRQGRVAARASARGARRSRSRAKPTVSISIPRAPAPSRTRAGTGASSSRSRARARPSCGIPGATKRGPWPTWARTPGPAWCASRPPTPPMMRASLAPGRAHVLEAVISVEPGREPMRTADERRECRRIRRYCPSRSR